MASPSIKATLTTTEHFTIMKWEWEWMTMECSGPEEGTECRKLHKTNMWIYNCKQEGLTTTLPALNQEATLRRKGHCPLPGSTRRVSPKHTSSCPRPFTHTDPSVGEWFMRWIHMEGKPGMLSSAMPFLFLPAPAKCCSDGVGKSTYSSCLVDINHTLLSDFCK